jgi:GNAT superfamily N-acetyltransferase
MMPASTRGDHPLTRIFEEVAAGRLPPADSEVEVFASPPGPVDAVVGFTAHHCVAAPVDRTAVLARLPPGELTAPLSAGFLTWLADMLGSSPGSLDMFLLAPDAQRGVEPLERRSDLGDHPRVARSRRYREDLSVYSDRTGAGVVIIGRGLARRWEVSVEVAPEARNHGLARRLAVAARTLVPADEPLWAQVAPANAASVRAVLAAGYVPIGAEVLFPRKRVAA